MAYRKRIPIAPIPINGDDDFRHMYLFVRVSRTGRANLEGMVRKPYSDRQIRGGGVKSVPWSALNPRRRDDG